MNQQQPPAIFQPGSLEPTGQGFRLGRYLHYWYLFVLGVGLALAGALLYLRYTTPLYSISASVLIKDKRDQTGMSRTERFDYANDESVAKNLDNEVILLKSMSLMQRVLTELSLNTTYYVRGKVREQEILASALPFRVEVARLDSTILDKVLTITPKAEGVVLLEEDGQAPATYSLNQPIRRPYGVFTLVRSATPAAYNGPVTVRFQPAHEVTLDYVRRLSVSAVNKQASILTLTLTEAVPEKGKLILNRLVEVYNKEAEEDKNLVAANTIAFIDDRLQYLGTELTDVEKGVESFKQRNQVADMNSQVNQSLLDASEYGRQAAEYDIQLSALESISRYLTNPANLDQLIPSALSVSNPTLSEAITKFNELQLDRTRMLRTAQASNPVVENMTEQLKNLRDNVLANITSTKISVQAARRSLVAKSGQSGARIQQAPTVERGLQRINRQQELKRSLYLFLLQKREEAALSLAASVSSARVVDPASVGKAPISPQKPAVVVLALLLGLGVPFAFVYLTGLLDDKVQLMSDVTQVMEVPILGELIHADAKQSPVITKHDRSALAEVFRMVRTNFLFATDGQPNQVILVTSSQEGEGKTFFSLNLGASLALAGKRVVLVNLDLRKPHAHTDRPGITNYLLDDHLVMSDLAYPAAEAEGLYKVSTGPLPANPAELLLHPRMAAALAALRQQFDHIILDSSPIGQVSDAFALAPYLDYTIFLVRYNFTRKAQLNIANQVLFNQKMPPMALVLNDARKNNQQEYGYGKGYGYGYPSAKSTVSVS